MPKQNKKNINKEQRSYNVEIPRRDFYVNGILEFSLFYDPIDTDKDTIIAAFREDKDWKWFEGLYKVKYKTYKFSKDLKRVDITTTPKHKKGN